MPLVSVDKNVDLPLEPVVVCCSTTKPPKLVSIKPLLPLLILIVPPILGLNSNNLILSNRLIVLPLEDPVAPDMFKLFPDDVSVILGPCWLCNIKEPSVPCLSPIFTVGSTCNT